MKKFKTRKEILDSAEFKRLAFELLKEEGYGSCIKGKHKVANDEELETRIKFFQERKLQQCKMQGV